MEAPFIVDFDKKQQVLTRWLRLGGASNGRGGLHGAHLIPVEPDSGELKELRRLRRGRDG